MQNKMITKLIKNDEVKMLLARALQGPEGG